MGQSDNARESELAERQAPMDYRTTGRSADELLAEMAAAGRLAGQSGQVVELAGREVQRGARPPKMRYSHQAMAQLVAENPWITQNELGAVFGYSAAWISTVMTSDAFKNILAQWQDSGEAAEMRLTIRERYQAMTEQSLRVLQEKLAKPADAVPDNLAIKAAELGAKALGLGGHAPVPVVVTSEDRLSKLAHRLIALRGENQTEVVDV